jgi:hypothetical protein
MIRMEVSNMQSFLDYFGKIHERTMRAVAWIPLDKIEWRRRRASSLSATLPLAFSPSTRDHLHLSPQHRLR